ncbi:cupin domain-containing protein [Rhodococcus sp. USK13]|uniref:cupin domain-containing protein n=1 Tax=Rhodococcus sp. USK13 TaxID=2806442 RepID=UPI001BD0BDBB|nr:cupin domain-containing protein [Rhodococcus sp. USK13]
MPTYTPADEREWIHEDVVGHAIDRCKLWYDGHDVSFSLVKMSWNSQLTRHRHDTWVAVFLVQGNLHYKSGDVERFCKAGDFYFVPPGEDHVETSVGEALVLVIKHEPNKQYPVDEHGNRLERPRS